MSAIEPHHSARSEWWYFTGRVADLSGREYYYVLAFFRSRLGVELSRFAHFLLHSPSRSGIACERSLSPFGRRTHIQPKLLDIDYSGWTACFDRRSIIIRAEQDSYSLDLKLSPGTLLITGCEGWVKVGKIRTQCRSFPRLVTEGEVRLGNDLRKVRGISWLDHEWGALPLVHRWDWWGINLEDGGDLVIRHAGSRGVANLRHSDGHTETKVGTILARPTRYWRSARGTLYPIDWMVKIPDLEADVEISAEHDSCETPFHVRYWEGPCRARARFRNTRVEGRGYMELVGYERRILRFVSSRIARLVGDLVFRNRCTDLREEFPSP